MVSRKRKQGVFAVNSDVVVLSISKDERSNCMPISEAIGMVFNQMLIEGNRPHTIDSYEYICNQFVEIGRKEYVKDINLYPF